MRNNSFSAPSDFLHIQELKMKSFARKTVLWRLYTAMFNYEKIINKNFISTQFINLT